jgi:hypothetical protein
LALAVLMPLGNLVGQVEITAEVVKILCFLASRQQAVAVVEAVTPQV